MELSIVERSGVARLGEPVTSGVPFLKVHCGAQGRAPPP